MSQFSFPRNRICETLGIKVPVFQGGMVWCSEAPLAIAVARCGGLGTLGSGSMYPDQLKAEIEGVKSEIGNTSFAVNIPLIYPHVEEHIEIVINQKVPIIITSAGSPSTHTARLKAAGCKVIHVVSSVKFAQKSEAAGVDAVVAEGFEAGGHNGRDETTTLCLVPEVCAAVNIPVVAAGGIGTGQAMYAAMSLGAEGVQMGSRFLVSKESSAHSAYKSLLVSLSEGQTHLTLKELAPVRMVKNKFWHEVQLAYEDGASVQQLRALLGKGRSRLGISIGDLDNGELVAGQVVSQFSSLPTVREIFSLLEQQWEDTHRRMHRIHLND